MKAQFMYGFCKICIRENMCIYICVVSSEENDLFDRQIQDVRRFFNIYWNFIIPLNIQTIIWFLWCN